MTDSSNDEAVTRILELMWHSPHNAVTAGGFIRTCEILKHIPAGIKINAVDNAPTFLADLTSDRLTVHEYRVPGLIRRLEARFYRVERMLERVISFALICAVSLRLRLRGDRFDVIYVPYSEILAMLAAGVVAKLMFRGRLVLVNHNIEHFRLPLRLVVVWLHNRADQVIAVSEDLKAKLVARGVRTPIAVNSNGLDSGKIGAVAAANAGVKIYDAVFVGRHVPAKGIFDLLEAWGRVVDRLQDARLVMVGSCDPVTAERLDALIERLGIRPNVEINGVVDDGQKLRLISQSKLLLFPSMMEGWGLVPQEALACGLPVVVYDLPVYAENIKHCDAVFTVPAGDILGLARQAVALLERDAWRAHADTGPEFVKRFDWNDIARREFTILAGAAGGGAQ
jgi:glycosyltransferase involved in cell wall biosynthesis